MNTVLVKHRFEMIRINKKKKFADAGFRVRVRVKKVNAPSVALHLSFPNENREFLIRCYECALDSMHFVCSTIIDIRYVF